MNSLRAKVRGLLRRAPLPHRLRVWLRPIARQLVFHWLLRAPAKKRLVSRATPPADLPSLDDATACLPFAMPSHSTPTISVVIPFCNQHAMTVRCLHGLSRHQSRHAFEVICVDDGSNESGREAIGRIDGIRIVRHDETKGFIASSNAGAALASGEFLLFLNNDTYPQQGLLDELVATFDRFTDAGAVGAALLHPNGRLQEAGGIVWDTGDALNVGRGFDPDDPDFSFAREVDYCSAACLMIRRTLFEKLGGFDLRYEPAYYEDTDLCFRVREAGLRVYVQPLARAIHVEGATAGTDPSSGLKRFQTVNRRKFCERWAGRLGLAPTPAAFGTATFVLPGQRRIVIIDSAIATPNEDAGSVILMEIIERLKRLGYLIVLGVQETPELRDERVRALERCGIQVVRAPYYRSIVEYISVHEGQFDLVLMVRHAVAEQVLPQIKGLATRVPTILLNPDLHYLRTAREAEVRADEGLARRAAEDKAWELGVIAQVDATLTHSEMELELLRAELPGKHVVLLPWIVRPASVVPAFEARHGVLFVGNFAHPPNADSIVHFVRTMWPKLRERLPDITLRIVGARPPIEIRSLAGDGVAVAGHVDDLTDEYDRARIAIAPLRFGAGFKGKVAHAMAAGLPSVISPVAAEGMGLADGRTCLIAQPGTDFVDAIVRLHDSAELWNLISANGQRFVAAKWSPEQAETRLIDVLQNARVAPTLRLSDLIESKANASLPLRQDVIVFPAIDWSFQRQRPQQIAIELGKRGHRVFYLTEHFAPAALPRPYLIWGSPAKNVYVVQLRCPEPHPNIYKAPPSRTQADGLAQSLAVLRENCRIAEPLLLVDLPFWRSIACALNGTTIYDCMDLHAGFKNNAAAMLGEEDRLIAQADVVITSSASLSERVGAVRSNILVRNGCEPDHFIWSSDKPVHRLSERPVVGYFGVLDHWFDADLVGKAATAYPAWDFVLIGRQQDCDLDALRRLPNVSLIGEVAYQALPRFAAGFDVCMIPFLINDLTRHTNPVKLYEYLAAGKPVVGTAMPEIMIDGLVSIAHDERDFIAKLGAAMALHREPALIERRVAFARMHTWADRVDRIERAVASVQPQRSLPRASP
jgi:GT2 family glycosyltransferase/glycosyltransferase involved in cell wall biosynthesis